MRSPFASNVAPGIMSDHKIGSSGAECEPDLKRRRLLDAGGPVEDDETARKKMRDAKVYYKEEDVGGEFTGFDPESVCQKATFDEVDGPVSPMGYFAEKGDLPMMRWLYVNGADTRDPEVDLCFPMYTAAIGRHLEACKWLYDHGAAQDIKRRVPLWLAPTDLSPLSATSRKSHIKRYFLLGKWLILKGALCKDDGDLDLVLIERDLNIIVKRRKFLEWAKGQNQAREAFLAFLMGTLPPPDYSHLSLRHLLVQKLQSEEATDKILGSLPSSQYHQLWDDLLVAKKRACPVSTLSGKSGVLETICNFLGIARGREARIFRQLTEVSPKLSKEME